MAFTEKDLEKMGLKQNSDGSYSKAKTTPQPREIKPPVQTIKQPFASNDYRTVKLILLGEPMPKQSVRSTKSGHFFQPAKYKQREKDYRKQIAKQLPADFSMFTEEVMISKMHFYFSPPKSFQKKKGYMERIRSGELIPKTTKPDLPDNLKKLASDAMSGLVFKDDSIIWAEDNTRKYYSTGGCIIIELIGK